MLAVPQNTYHFEIALLWHLARGEEKGNMDIKGTLFPFSRFKHRSILFWYSLFPGCVQWSFVKSLKVSQLLTHICFWEKQQRNQRKKTPVLQTHCSTKLSIRQAEKWQLMSQTNHWLLTGSTHAFWLNFQIQNQVAVLNSPTFPDLAQWTLFPFYTNSATASPTDICPRACFYPPKL